MTEKEFLGLVSIIFGALGYGSYFWLIFRGRNRPHMFSWIVWGTVSGVACLAQLAKHGGAGSWAAGASAVVCYLIAAVASVRGEKNITKSDWTFFVGALAALPLWYVTNEPLWSVILVVIIDALGFYPTVRKSYIKPQEESALMYTIDAGKFIFSIFALETYSVTTILYPLCAVFLNTGLVTMLLYRRFTLRRLTK